jgi:hypothetical protein
LQRLGFETAPQTIDALKMLLYLHALDVAQRSHNSSQLVRVDISRAVQHKVDALHSRKADALHRRGVEQRSERRGTDDGDAVLIERTSECCGDCPLALIADIPLIALDVVSNEIKHPSLQQCVDLLRSPARDIAKGLSCATRTGARTGNWRVTLTLTCGVLTCDRLAASDGGFRERARRHHRPSAKFRNPYAWYLVGPRSVRRIRVTVRRQC